MILRPSTLSLAWIIFFLTLISGGNVNAASFNCEMAVSQIEQLICRDPELNSLDSQLRGAYAGALDRSNHPDQITRDQRSWIKERNSCTDEKCLIAVYQQRTASLSKISDEPIVCNGASTPEVDACEEEYAHRADKELARYLAVARKRIVDEAVDELNSQTSKTTLAAFDASEQAWELYRKAECNAVYDHWIEGTIRGFMYGACMQSVTKSRTEQIWSEWLTFMDSTPPLLPKPVSK
jgi:uncharacterized protein